MFSRPLIMLVTLLSGSVSDIKLVVCPLVDVLLQLRPYKRRIRSTFVRSFQRGDGFGFVLVWHHV